MRFHGRLLQVLGLCLLLVGIYGIVVLLSSGPQATMAVWVALFALFAWRLIIRGWVDAWSFLSGRAKPQRHECAQCGTLLSEDKPEVCPDCGSEVG